MEGIVSAVIIIFVFGIASIVHLSTQKDILDELRDINKKLKGE